MVDLKTQIVIGPSTQPVMEQSLRECLIDHQNFHRRPRAVVA